jgi:hypothetical protein
VVLAVGFGIANGRPRNKKNIVRSLTRSHRLRYIQSCFSRVTNREAQTTGVSCSYVLTQAKMLMKSRLELLRPPTLDPALLRFLSVAKAKLKMNLAPATTRAALGKM